MNENKWNKIARIIKLNCYSKDIEYWKAKSNDFQVANELKESINYCVFRCETNPRYCKDSGDVILDQYDMYDVKK